MEAGSPRPREPGSEDPPGEAPGEKIIFWFDVWNRYDDLIARFEEDGERASLYLITPQEKILALVTVYRKAAWPDVQAEEVEVTWEYGDIERCVATVRGRRRYIDVQLDEPRQAVQQAA